MATKSFAEIEQEYKKAVAEGKTLSNSKSFVKIYEAYKNNPMKKIVDSINKQIIELDRELDSLPGLALTDEEKENFLQKAITQVQPYYDRKSSEVEKGIQEGSIRSAEDILLFTRDVENEIATTLSSLDLKQAQTEEEFLNTLANITSGRDENLETKREEWRMRVENLKLDQVQSGVFSSGIGKMKRDEAARLKAIEEGQIISQADRAQTQAETTEKYNLEQIRLAREASARDRAARIGAPDETESMKQQNLSTLGLSDMSQLGGKAQIETARAGANRNVDIYNPSAKTSLEEERLKAVEARKQELQAEELAVRNQEYERQRQKILADKAAAQSRLSSYGGTY